MLEMNDHDDGACHCGDAQCDLEAQLSATERDADDDAENGGSSDVDGLFLPEAEEFDETDPANYCKLLEHYGFTDVRAWREQLPERVRAALLTSSPGEPAHILESAVDALPYIYCQTSIGGFAIVVSSCPLLDLFDTELTSHDLNVGIGGPEQSKKARPDELVPMLGDAALLLALWQQLAKKKYPALAGKVDSKVG